MEDLEKLAFMLKGEVLKHPDNLLKVIEILSGVLADLAKKASESDDMQLVTSALELFLIFKVGDKLEDKKSIITS